MFITAIYQNGDCKLVRSDCLDELIFNCEIKQFLRIDGWVTVGCDPVRMSGNGCVCRERRHKNDKGAD
jgi:hypothetical protein